MKFLFRTNNGEIEFIRQWLDGDDSRRLPAGNYIVAGKLETIIVHGSGNNDSEQYDLTAKQSRSNNDNDTNDTQTDTTRDVEDIGHYEIDEKLGAVAVIRYIDGLRYSVNGKEKERFPVMGEPIMHKGKPFTGRIDEAGKKIVIKKAVKSKQEKPADSEISELAKLAESMAEGLDVEEKPFDEEAAFDDMLDVSEPAQVGKAVDKTLFSVDIGEDKMTVTVVCEGDTYIKTFKSEAVAERQFEVIKGTIADDRSMVKDLVEGPTSTFVKQ